MGRATDGTLLLLPPLRAGARSDGRTVLTRKFIDGVTKYLEYWSGPIKVVLEGGADASGNLDEVDVGPGELPFELRVVPFDSPRMVEHLRGVTLAHGTTSCRQNELAKLAHGVGVPFIYTAEYSLRTRLQIVRSEEANPARRIRRTVWESRQEFRQRQAIREAEGVQCNGTPTYDAYAPISRNALLYFDSRSEEKMLIRSAALEQRLLVLDQQSPLRLLYSGRLNAIKGADHLPRIADALRKRGLDFHLTICGGGELEDSISAEIDRLGLGPHVFMAGVLDFKTELLPRVKTQTDLFLCPHVQGDPACTYMETLSCGVPIVGFDNEAFLGIVRREPVGWATPLGDAEKVADKVLRLDQNRAELKEASRRALALARQHTFEATFRRRVDHFRECASSKRH